MGGDGASAAEGASNEVTIGNQLWMNENLNVDKFRNGDPIPEAKTDEEWVNAGKNKQPAWCYYDNDTANGTKYGKLYNWYAVNDSRGLAPEGWHVPTDEEWTVLTDYLGGEDVAGTKMKSKNRWEKDGNGTNESGFSGLPGGFRFSLGIFSNNGGYWWSSTENWKGSAWYRLLKYHDGGVYKLHYAKDLGLSVRCLRD
ncbi:MAG: fibrobacter succinogenes major paralogous domain-containing protein [Crocinitomicaceae bacterium]